MGIPGVVANDAIKAGNAKIIGGVENDPLAQFAFIQLVMANRKKHHAEARMDAINKEQTLQNEMHQKLQLFKKQSEVADKSGSAPISQADLDWCIKNEFLSASTTSPLDAKAWSDLCSKVNGKLGEIGASLQQQLVIIQDELGQYHGYIQGSSTNVSASNKTIFDLSRFKTS